MKIYFIRHETSYGPFFSTREQAIDCALKRLEDNTINNSPTYIVNRINDILKGTDPYISIEDVTLDDEDVCFDG